MENQVLSIVLRSNEADTFVMIPLVADIAFEHVGLSLIGPAAHTEYSSLYITKVDTFVDDCLLLSLAACLLAFSLLLRLPLGAATVVDEILYFLLEDVVFPHDVVVATEVVLSSLPIVEILPKLIDSGEGLAHVSLRWLDNLVDFVSAL